MDSNFYLSWAEKLANSHLNFFALMLETFLTI